MKHEDIDHTGLTGVGGLSDPMTTRGDVIIRNASNVTARLARGSASQVLTSDGTDVAWATPSAGGGGGLLAYLQYTGTLTPSTSSGTLGDVDATNLKVTFTAPASGNVLVRMQAFAQMSGSGYQVWGLRESTTNLTPTAVAGLSGSSGMQAHVDLIITGITAGSHTYKWAWRAQTSTAQLFIDSVDGPGLMEVWAAP
jgi:hypothetical protein